MSSPLVRPAGLVAPLLVLLSLLVLLVSALAADSLEALRTRHRAAADGVVRLSTDEFLAFTADTPRPFDLVALMFAGADGYEKIKR